VPKFDYFLAYLARTARGRAVPRYLLGVNYQPVETISVSANFCAKERGSFRQIGSRHLRCFASQWSCPQPRADLSCRGNQKGAAWRAI